MRRDHQRRSRWSAGRSRPDIAVTLGELLAPLGYWKKDDNPAEVVRQWSSEALYHLLAKNRERIDLRALDSNAGITGKDLALGNGKLQNRRVTTHLKRRFAPGVRA